MTRLTNLNVDRNRLEELPPTVGNLVNLGVLSLRENQLRYLPHEIGTCAELPTDADGLAPLPLP